MLDFPLTLTASPEAAGQRLDQYLATQLSEFSRARVQQLIAKGEVLVNNVAAKASLRLKGTGDEQITVTGPPHAPPLRAIAEEIALDIVYEDDVEEAAGGVGSHSNKRQKAGMPATVMLDKNFVHSGVLEMAHPGTKESLK